jgi:hypothetical protein
MLLDKHGFGCLMQALKDGTKLEWKNFILKKGAFGAHLVVDHGMDGVSERRACWLCV